jgi:Cu+-exporting ATPase
MEKKFLVEGMHCASCVARVEKQVSAIDGVSSVAVSINNQSMRVVINDESLIDEIIKKVSDIGYQAKLEDTSKEISVRVKGITCSNCVKTIEQTLSKMEGVESAKVNMVHNTARIIYQESKVSLNDIKEKVSSIGYQIESVQFQKEDYTDEEMIKGNRKRQLRLMVSIIFTAILLVISMGEMVGLVLPNFMSPDHNPLVFALLQLTLTIPPVIMGRHFYSKGFKLLYKLSPNMDSLIAIGTSAAIIYSLFSTIQIGLYNEMYHLYYETAATIITLILLGKYLEDISKTKASSAVKDLLNLTPDYAILIEGDQEREILVEEVQVGDLLLIKPGSRIPVDGIIVKGTSSVDESMITGESLPINKDKNDKVIAGSINNSGLLTIKTKRVGQDTTLSKIIELVEKAEMSKAPIAKLADVISGYFVPAIIGISIVSLIVWLIAGKSVVFSLTIAITVLVIACPCALGLATPTSIVVGTGMAAKHGILFKNGETIENAHKIDAIIFDKTGTLTMNKPLVQDIIGININEVQLISLMASAEKNSNHPLAKAIQRYAKKENITIKPIDQLKEIPGKGIEFEFEDETYYLGSLKYLKQMKISFKNVKINAPNKSIIFLGKNSSILGYVTMIDQVKPEAYNMIQKINALDIETHILSGDNYEATAMVADQLKVKSIHANVLPEDKYKEVKKLQKLGKKVCMVGDGINDSIALKQADIGISLSSSTDVALTSADIVLMRNSLDDIVKSLDMSRKIIRNIKQNLFFAFIYNSLGIPFAAGLIYAFGGPLLNPMIAALAMSVSSVSVVLNSLRIKRYIYK